MLIRRAGIAVVLSLVWALAASCAPGDTTPETEGAALVDPDPAGPEPLAAATDPDLPKWRVFFAGDPSVVVKVPGGRPGAAPVYKKTYLLEPSVVDGVCPLILVPRTEAGVDRATNEWIKLSAALLRNRGLDYFMKVVEKYRLDVRDLIAIRSLLKDIDTIPIEPASVLGDASFADYEGAPQFGAPDDGGPDEHTVGPWGMSGRGATPPQPGPVRAKQPSYHPGFPHLAAPSGPPSPSGASRRSPNGDPGGYSTRDKLNGLNPQDQPESNYPGWDDLKKDPSKREVFRCDGHVVFGYRNMCPDYNLLPNERWSHALDEFSMWLVGDVRHSPDEWKTSPWILRNFWHDGKKPECLQDAEENARYLCVSAVGLGFVGCTLTPGCLETAASTGHGLFGVFAGTTIGYPACHDWITGYARQNICTK